MSEEDKGLNFWNLMGYTDYEWSLRNKFESEYNEFYKFSVTYEEDLEMIG